jgi:hypothetical protein
MLSKPTLRDTLYRYIRPDGIQELIFQFSSLHYSHERNFSVSIINIKQSFHCQNLQILLEVINVNLTYRFLNTLSFILSKTDQINLSGCVTIWVDHS